MENTETAPQNDPLIPAGHSLGMPIKGSALGWHLYLFKLEDPVIGPTKSLKLRVAEIYYRRNPEGTSGWVEEVVRVWFFAGEESYVQYLAERSEPFNMAGSLRFRVMGYGLDEAKRVFPAFQLLLDGTVLPADKDEVNRLFKAYLGRPFAHIDSWSRAAERFNKLEAEGIPRMPDTRFARELEAEDLEERMGEAMREQDKAEGEEAPKVVPAEDVTGLFKAAPEPGRMTNDAEFIALAAKTTEDVTPPAPSSADQTAPDPVEISRISVIDRGGKIQCQGQGIFLRVETEPYPGRGAVADIKVSDFPVALALKQLLQAHRNVIREHTEDKGEPAWKGLKGPGAEKFAAKSEDYRALGVLDVTSTGDFVTDKLRGYFDSRPYQDVTQRIAKPLAEQHSEARIEGLTEIYRSAQESLAPKENAAEPPAAPQEYDRAKSLVKDSVLDPDRISVKEYGDEWAVKIRRPSQFSGFGSTLSFSIPKSKTAEALGVLLKLAYVHAGEVRLMAEKGRVCITERNKQQP
jgi:hypothetical protein